MHKIECQTFDKTVFDNLICVIKVVDRNVKTLTFNFDFMTKIESDFIINAEVTSKTSSNTYKNIFFNLSTNLCGDLFESPLIKLVLPIIEKNSPGLLHKCPYLPEKNYGLHDFILDLNLISLITFTLVDRMDYRIFITYIYKKKVVATLTLYFKITSKKYSRKKQSSKPTIY